MGILPF